MISFCHVGTLFGRFLFLASCGPATAGRGLLLSGGEPLDLFAADRAFSHVISAVIVSHDS
jgi:hypothetical protein